MKTELASVELHYLISELSQLVGSKVDRIYEGDDEEDKDARRDFLFVFHKTGVGKQMLRIRLPGLVYLTSHKQQFPEKPPGFCMFLRKHLASARIESVRQHGFDRILEIVFDTREGKRILIIEMFSRGNIVLIDGSYKVVGLLESQSWQSRTVRGGAAYEYPPSMLDLASLDEDDFLKLMSESGKDSIVKTLAVDFGLGGTYAEEICKRASIDKKQAALSKQEAGRLLGCIRTMLAEKTLANRCGDELFPIKISGCRPEKTYESFSRAIDENLTEKITITEKTKEIKRKNKESDKIRLIIEKQEERLRELEKECIESQRKGELIYEHFSDIKKLLESMNEDRKKMGWDEIKKKYSAVKKLKAIDEKHGKLELDL